MHLMYFTEQPMKDYPADAGLEIGFTSLLMSNKHFDPVVGSRLYNEFLENYVYAEEMGVDGIMLNEHHNAPFCMQAKANIFASLLAGMTKRVKIVLLGNPLPLTDNPVRLAEELAMIDMISKGRLVSGFVRGGGQEQLATNANPAYNRERFQEAHDLIVKAWTVHYHQRVVNPWAVPLQQPHPRIWIPGVISHETIIWAAQHGYPYIALNTSIEDTKKIWARYDAAAAEVGYTPGPENRGYLIRCHVAETEEKALESARQFLWMDGEFTGRLKPVWASPSGYFSPSSRETFVNFVAGQGASPSRPRKSFEQQVADMQIIAGTPEQVVKSLRIIMRETRPGIMAFWGNEGRMTQEAARTSIRLLGQEVMPALRETAKELDLKSPFEADMPVSRAFAGKSEKVAAE